MVVRLGSYLMKSTVESCAHQEGCRATRTFRQAAQFPRKHLLRSYNFSTEAPNDYDKSRAIPAAVRRPGLQELDNYHRNQVRPAKGLDKQIPKMMSMGHD